MNESSSSVTFIAALFIFIASLIKALLFLIALRVLSTIYPFIFPTIGATPWWVYVLYFLVIFSGTMFVYSLLLEKKREVRDVVK